METSGASSHQSTVELLDRWLSGWCRCRAISRSAYGSGWLVEVAAESRLQEFFIADPSLDEITLLLAELSGRADVWLTVVGEPGADERAALVVAEAITRDEMMMTSVIVRGRMPPEVRIEDDGTVARARVEVYGRVAATGNAALNSSDVIFDRIGTQPEFRRRGLGGLIMTALTSWAAERGATTGLLFASTEGRRLYDSLGWLNLEPIVTYRGRDR